MNQLRAPSNQLLSVSIPWTPRAKGRPRATKGGVFYTPPETRKAEREFLEAFRDLCPDWEPYPDPIGVTMAFHNEYVNLTISTAPDYTQRKLRGDLDNYIKLCSDSLNKFAWLDDKQINYVVGEKL